MANILAYPTGVVKADDLILGVSIPLANTNEVAITKNFTASSISALGVGYTSYTALVSQTGTDAPVAAILANTTSGTMTWTRSSSGVYVVTASSAVFTSAKTIVFMNLGEYSGGGIPRSVWTRNSDTQITISNGGDDRMTNGAFEVRIYS